CEMENDKCALTRCSRCGSEAASGRRRLVSYHQPLARDLPVKDYRTFLSSKRALDVRLSSFRTQERDTATAACAADLCRFCAVGQSFCNQRIHLRSCYRGCELLSIGISGAHRGTH